MAMEHEEDHIGGDGNELRSFHIVLVNMVEELLDKHGPLGRLQLLFYMSVALGHVMARPGSKSRFSEYRLCLGMIEAVVNKLQAEAERPPPLEHDDKLDALLVKILGARAENESGI